MSVNGLPNLDDVVGKNVSDKPLAVSNEKNREFGLGAQRDGVTGKGSPVLISPYFIERVAKHLERGAKKYCPRNWEKGMPLSVYLDSLLRHIMALQMGDDGEDHAAAVGCNIMFFIQTKHMIDKGLLPESMNDLVDYEHINTVEEFIARLNTVSGQCVEKDVE